VTCDDDRLPAGRGAAGHAWPVRHPRPVCAPDRCAGYVLIGRNYNTDQPDRVIREFEDTILARIRS
jgi:hypothetical protein